MGARVKGVGEGVRRWGKGLAGGCTSKNLMHIFYITPEVDLN